MTCREMGQQTSLWGKNSVHKDKTYKGWFVQTWELSDMSEMFEIHVES